MKKRNKLFLLSNLFLLFLFIVVETGLNINIYTNQIKTSREQLLEYERLNKDIFQDNLSSGPSYASKHCIDTFYKISEDIYVSYLQVDSLNVIAKSTNFTLSFSQDSISANINQITEVKDSENNPFFYYYTLDETNNFYIVTAIIKPRIINVIGIYIGYGILFYLILSVFFYFMINRFLKMALTPIKEQVTKMEGSENQTPNDEEVTTDSIQAAIEQIAKINQIKIANLISESEQKEYIIDSIPQGLIVIDHEGNIILVNKSGEKIISTSFKLAKGKPLTSFFRKKEVNDIVNKAKSQNISTYKEYVTADNKYYKINIYSLINNNTRDVCLVFNDVTQEKILSKSKRDFFANASHELKSPLTTIKGYVQLIKENIIVDEKEKEKTFDRVISEANRMNDIIIQMLDLSKLEVTKPTICDDISCMEIVNETKAILQKMAQDKNISMHVSGNDFEIHMMREDALSLIKNIVENAVLYNKIGGDIYISLDTDKSISIRDTGIGIPQKYQERIFERFYRVDKAKSRKMGGTGLGLSIVKHICINYKLKLELTSKLGEGTSITIHF